MIEVIKSVYLEREAREREGERGRGMSLTIKYGVWYRLQRSSIHFMSRMKLLSLTMKLN